MNIFIAQHSSNLSRESKEVDRKDFFNFKFFNHETQ